VVAPCATVIASLEPALISIAHEHLNAGSLAQDAAAAR